MGVVGILIVIGLALIWTLDVPVPAKLDDGRIITDRVEAATIRGNQITVFRPIAESTTLPWTIIAAVGAITYLFFHFVTKRSGSAMLKKTLMVLWALSFPVLVLVLIRDPMWDWGAGLRIYLPALLIFGTFGAAVLWFVARPGSGEAARIVGGLLLVAAFITFPVPDAIHLPAPDAGRGAIWPRRPHLRRRRGQGPCVRMADNRVRNSVLHLHDIDRLWHRSPNFVHDWWPGAHHHSLRHSARAFFPVRSHSRARSHIDDADFQTAFHRIHRADTRCPADHMAVDRIPDAARSPCPRESRSVASYVPLVPWHSSTLPILPRMYEVGSSQFLSGRRRRPGHWA